MSSRAAGRRFPSGASLYPLAAVAMLGALLAVLLDLVYVAFRSRGDPDAACAASVPRGAEVLPGEQAVGHRSWWPPSVACEHPSLDPTAAVVHSLTPGSQLVFWAAVVVFAAGLLIVGAVCLGPAHGPRRPVDPAG
ncbi:hypothetical protein [Kocuria nitroreducens]|uniref:hypothetical protein n=1 Tax=Kocuria nitroreducens TaxID=3058914 RepID=UPI0036DA9AD8